MKALRFLEQYKRKQIDYKKTKDYSFYSKYQEYLSELPKYSFLTKLENDEFDIFRTNILLHGIISKKLIEKAILKFENSEMQSFDKKETLLNYVLADKLEDSPFIMHGNDKIYIPFFSHALNLIYLTQTEKVLSFPYSALKNSYQDSCIDPFDTYGIDLYDSKYSNLKKIYAKNNCVAFYHDEFKNVYIVNKQGRLDAKICLFDRFCRHPNFENIEERLQPVLEAFFAYDRSKFLDELLEQKFISIHLFKIIKFFDWRRVKK